VPEDSSLYTSLMMSRACVKDGAEATKGSCEDEEQRIEHGKAA